MSWVVVLLALASAAAADDYDDILKAYKSYLKRPSLHMRMRGRLLLAGTEDARALRVLERSYAKPEKPKDHVRYLLATVAVIHFPEEEYLPVYAAWRGRHDEPADAWLWYHSLRRLLQRKGPAGVESVVRGKDDFFLRVAAYEVLVAAKSRSVLPIIPEWIGDLPKEGVHRAVVVESLARGLLARKEDRKKKEFTAPAAAVIGLLDDKATAPRSRLVLARHFCKLFDGERLFLEAEPWLNDLRAIQAGGKRSSNEGYARRTTFAGLKAAGDRIAYVIDLSDSMLTPLTPEERKKLPKGPVTGIRKPTGKEPGARKWLEVAESIRWDKVENRFDAARELLKLSLLTLDKGKSFSVIWFGDKTDTFKSTKGLVPATPDNVRKMAKELDAIRPGPTKKHRPHGTLRGRTNLHGGLRRAFKLRSGRMVGRGEYVDPVTWSEGCDTLFLLSDGKPTWDDWGRFDKRDPSDRAGDMETGSFAPTSERLEFPGFYHQDFYLLDDVRRLNLFRKVEIHCVGIGEANMELLGKLAALGLGETIRIGG